MVIVKYTVQQPKRILSINWRNRIIPTGYTFTSMCSKTRFVFYPARNQHLKSNTKQKPFIGRICIKKENHPAAVRKSLTNIYIISVVLSFRPEREKGVNGKYCAGTEFCCSFRTRQHNMYIVICIYPSCAWHTHLGVKRI